MRVTTSRSKNAESFYISKVYINDKGVKGKPLRKKVRGGNRLPYFATMQKIAESQ